MENHYGTDFEMGFNEGQHKGRLDMFNAMKSKCANYNRVKVEDYEEFCNELSYQERQRTGKSGLETMCMCAFKTCPIANCKAVEHAEKSLK
jgi:hypothetical protein